MSISRRVFIKVGTLAAIAAGISLRPGLSVMGQDVVDQIGAPVANDPLSNYTQATFAQYVNSVFRLRGRTVVDVNLMKVEDTLPAKVARVGGRESFLLHFRGGGVRLPQDTYTVEHAALGTFLLFLVPSGADENGAQGYIAVINRLAYTSKPLSPGVPRKPIGTKRSIVTPPDETKPLQEPAKTTPARPSRKGSTEPEGLGAHRDQ